MMMAVSLGVIVGALISATLGAWLAAWVGIVGVVLYLVFLAGGVFTAMRPEDK
jgi:hypothetical protein